MSNVLVLGASYGSLLATKLLLAGHSVRLVCLPAEAALINAEGTVVRVMAKGGSGLIDVASRSLPGQLSASDPTETDPSGFDLVVLAMQEPQYGAPGVRELVDRVGTANIPCLAIMNMPPLPYLSRIPGVPVDECRGCYTDPGVWNSLKPALMTMCSADPQAFRPAQEKMNVVQVGLPTNFKAARFESDTHTALLRGLERDIEAARLPGTGIELRVKLKVHDSVFVPLAKWPMLLTGNYRCIGSDSIRSIREAVHSDLNASRSIYEWVAEVCRSLGASEHDLVPFDKYAAAAQSLANPSSASRAVHAGARNIERPDRLVKTLGAKKGMRSGLVDDIVATVDARLETNRKKS
jgi:hypothetical protein